MAEEILSFNCEHVPYFDPGGLLEVFRRGPQERRISGIKNPNRHLTRRVRGETRQGHKGKAKPRFPVIHR